MESLAIALSGAGGGARASKFIWNFHNESPLYNEYMLKKWKKIYLQYKKNNDITLLTLSALSTRI
jgi:hypothetical protein